jgi:type IV pilus assembly protein PilE
MTGKIAGGRRLSGFTLMEVLIALAIAAIIITIAYPSYLGVLRESRRAEALEALMLIQLRQERYRSNNTSYATLAQLGMSATTPGGYYTLSITNPMATGYVAAATAVAGSSQVDDREQGFSCATLQVNQDEPVYAPAGQAACWKR